jgi:hypothetical protein
VQALLVDLVDNLDLRVARRIRVTFIAKVEEKALQPFVGHQFAEEVDDFPFEIG